MKKYLLVVYILSLTHIALAQNTTSRTLFWIDKDTSVLAKNVSYTYPFFTGCSFDNVRKLPAFGETFYTNADVHLNEYTSEIIPAVEAKKLDGINVPSEYIFEVTSGYDRGSATKQISLYPIRKNTNGSFERITSFSIRYTSSSNSRQNIQNTTGGRLSKAYQNSVLSSGKWVKLRISKTGVHKISPANLSKWGFSNINQVSIWGNGCGELPRSNDEPVNDDLLQLPTSIYNGSLIFYAEAKNSWNYNSNKDFFEHAQNEYSPYGYVFITDSRPVKNISGIPSESNPNYSTTTYDYRDYYEKVDTNFLKSGRRFFSNVLNVVSQITIGFTIPEPNTSSPLKLQVCAAAQSNSSSTFSISVNNGMENQLPIRGLSSGSFAMVDTALFSNITYGNSNINVKVAYNKPSTAAWGVLDFITLNARANLSLKNNQLPFRDAQSIEAGKITRFTINTTQSNVKVWDVTDIHNVQEPSLTIDGSNISFSLTTNTLREFIAFNETMLFEPEFIGSISNQNLHGQNSNPDYLVVTCPNFWEEANELALLHSDLDTWVVTTEQVYNEFSSGIPDPTAIRNFAKMLYHRSGNLKYLLLFGNGSYVNYEGKKGVSLVPTYQSGTSLTSDNTFVSDDYFGLLDNGESITDYGMIGSLDLGVGRFPVADEEQASTLVNKVRLYKNAISGSWMGKLVFIADDEDNNVHMSQSEELGNYVLDSFPEYDVNKVYFDMYPQIRTTIGERYPDVTEAINSAIHAGALMVNYTGHANDQWIAHEQVITQADIQQWHNRERLPLFVTATCEFSRFDDYGSISAGENVLLKPSGGGIAMLSTTRLVYSSGNAELNRQFIKQFFRKDAAGNHLRLGEIVRRTKNVTSTGVNQLNFSLLGDPALMLHFPNINIGNTTVLNDRTPSGNTDTIKSLARMFVGSKLAQQSPTSSDTIEATIYDKASLKATLGNDWYPYTYRDQSSVIFRGKSTTRNDSISTRFIVPKDIDYRYGLGKITYFGKVANGIAAGAYTNVVVGGVDDNPYVDSAPPSIRMYMNNEQFVSGGITTEAPTFIAVVHDSSGINTTGSGIGRDITLKIASNNKTYNLNGYYSADINSYTSGRIEFPIPPLDKGVNTATLKVFDIYNNSAEQALPFTVTQDEKFTITHLLNYPNPFTQKTAFFFEHNRPYTPLEVMIQIYTITGKLVKTIRYYIPESSNSLRSDPIEWDGRDDYGAKLGRGTYMYKAKVRCNTGETAEKVEKLVLLN